MNKHITSKELSERKPPHEHSTASIGYDIDAKRAFHHCWCGAYFRPKETEGDREKYHPNPITL